MPELVEKKEPPIIVAISKKKEAFSYDPDLEIPILETLLANDKNISPKLWLELNKIKNKTIKNIKYIKR